MIAKHYMITQLAHIVTLNIDVNLSSCMAYQSTAATHNSIVLKMAETMCWHLCSEPVKAIFNRFVA